MIVLGIETCSPSGGVALFDGERLLGVQMIHSSRAHSRLILPAIDTMLRENGLSVEGLGAVAVSAGPGSFTGVRVGLTLAKALCGSGTPPLVTVSTLEALAWRAWGGEAVGVVVPLLNARQGEVYGAILSVEEGQLAAPTEAPFACSPDELRGRLPESALLAGEGARVALARWEADGRMPDGVILARADRCDPSPEQVALLGWRSAIAGQFTEVHAAQPIYLREASISRPKKAGK